MQGPQFDNLMSGKPAKYALMGDGDNELSNSALSALFGKARQPDASPETVQEARAEIEKREVEISPAERARMDSFIAKQREIGTKERTIRRMVQRMWNITVI